MFPLQCTSESSSATYVTISPTKPVFNYNVKLVNPVRKSMSSGKFVVSQSAQDDYVWSKDSTAVTVEPFLGSPGPTRYISDDPMTGELLMTIVEETNRYAAQFASQQPSSNQREWKTSVEELKVYFGFMIPMGINQLPEIRDYWAKDPSHQSQTTSHMIDSKRSHAICTLLTMMFCLLVEMKATTDFKKFYQLSLPSTKHALATISQAGRTVLLRL